MADKRRLVALGVPTQQAEELAKQIDEGGGAGQAFTIAVRAEGKADDALVDASEAQTTADNALTAATPVGGYAAALAQASIPFLFRISATINGRLVEWIRQTGGPCLGGGWVPAGEVTLDHFPGARLVDCGPQLRAARDYCASIGGGVIKIYGRDNVLTSAETRSIYNIGSTVTDIRPIASGVYLTAGVSIRGQSRATSKITSSLTNTHISLLDYTDGGVSDLELEGPGATVGGGHGILSAQSGEEYFVFRDVRLMRLKIHNVASYGIGHQYCALSNVILQDVVIHDTGSDGIDWKVRTPRGSETQSDFVIMDNIEVRRFGLRAGAGSPTGLGIRGMAKLSNIHVYEVDDGQVAISIQPGTDNAERGDRRKSAFYTTLDNWFVEGKNKRTSNPAIAVEVWGVDRCIVGHGIAKWSVVNDKPSDVSPAAALHGPVYRGVLVIPPHNAYAASTIVLPRSSVDMVVQSDYDRFDIRAGSATLGQTVFTLPSGVPTANYAVVKNQVKLVEGSDFTVAGDVMTLAVGFAAQDTVCVVYPPARAVRINADQVTLTGDCDEFCPIGPDFGTPQNVDTSNILGFIWKGRAGISRQQSNVAGLMARSSAANEDLRLVPKGTGRVRIETGGLRLGTISCPTTTFTTTDGKTITVTGGIVTGVA